jgi:aldose 1-epimerase
MTIREERFGETPEGDFSLFRLRNDNGMEVTLTDYGAILTGWWVPDREGKLEDVVLGFDRLEGYLGEHPYFGAVVGRFANRIAGGQFTLDNKQYKLAVNNGPNHLHGGREGFNRRRWIAEPVHTEARIGIAFYYTSPDGEEGYPGKLDVRVTYTIGNDQSLRIHYEAQTDRPTVLNLTHHAYFNLKGAGMGDILDHRLTIHADRFTPVDENLIPTGELRPVAGTVLDFRQPRAIGEHIDDPDEEQLGLAGGYDHNFVIDGNAGTEPRPAAAVLEPVSGRLLEVLTTEPGVQLYTGNFLDGSLRGKNGHSYGHRSAFCLETQHFPDSPNRPEFPSAVLRPGETFRSTTIYRFSVDAEE